MDWIELAPVAVSDWQALAYPLMVPHRSRQPPTDTFRMRPVLLVAMMMTYPDTTERAGAAWAEDSALHRHLERGPLALSFCHTFHKNLLSPG